MRTPLTILAIGFVASLLGGPPAASHAQDAWQDLLGRDLRDWSRSGNGPTPWQFRSDRVLICTPAHEIYVPEWEFGDGTLRVEYRFMPDRGKKVANHAGLLIRKTVDTNGCKVALGEDCGSISATIIGSSDREKLIEVKAPPGLAKPAGEWNLLEVRLTGRTASVTVNGKEAATFERCEVDHGLIALEAEGSEIEFRTVWWKESGK